MIRIFIGYDPNETVAYHVLSHSIISRASEPLSITPLSLAHLKGVMTREQNSLQSTEFSFSRFLVPYLCGFEGFAIFMDCDMLLFDDIAKLWSLRDPQYAVQVVKHDHVPVEETKFLGRTQSKYGKKNWSSVMLFNNEKCRALTPEYVDNASGLELHQFKWLGNDDAIGGLDDRWNYLVDVQPPRDRAGLSNIHFTIGGPYFKDYAHCGYAEDWWQAYRDMSSCGNPVDGLHTPPKHRSKEKGGG
ncbi:glycosyltransferase [Magnetospira sp. QH-2]|uniref:glycosyltransferase n=1 Tax=Magnetospira sp. (strain QH-2) TaxID=1288970 RepID=UPI0003E81226|nr:glycosyltransferase [Magnetospira sp. QH-2]CCQ73064.1 conserved protein of unknown function [Magnetospira sp. QH-2]